jgi:hypothetical protein
MPSDLLAPYSNIDGVIAFLHSIGFGTEMTGEPMHFLL